MLGILTVSGELFESNPICQKQNTKILCIQERESNANKPILQINTEYRISMSRDIYLKISPIYVTVMKAVY